MHVTVILCPQVLEDLRAGGFPCSFRDHLPLEVNDPSLQHMMSFMLICQ